MQSELPAAADADGTPTALTAVATQDTAMVHECVQDWHQLEKSICSVTVGF